MEREEYSDLIKEIEEFLEESEETQQNLAMEIEETLTKLGFFGPMGRLLKSFEDELQAWGRVLQRMAIPREERTHAVLGAILATAYQRAKEKQ